MKIKRLSRLAPLCALALMLIGADAQTARPAQGYAVLTGDSAISARALARRIDPLFDATTTPSLGETRALIVLHHGRVIAERYAPGFSRDSRLPSWSLAKTVTGLIVGIMVSDGRMALDDPAPIPAWRQPGDPRGTITLRELMQMRSGLRNRESWSPDHKSDLLAMLVGAGAGDQAGYATAKPLIDAPGTHFALSSATSMILAGLVANQLSGSANAQARRLTMQHFLRARLIEPLGLSSLTPEYDARGTLIGWGMMHMTARDYARIGELIRLDGAWAGRQLVSDRWIRFMTTPSPANSAYGGQLWLNRAGSDNPLFPGEARSDLYGAYGEFGQFILVSPARHLTIVRLGITQKDDLPALRHALARLVQGIPVS